MSDIYVLIGESGEYEQFHRAVLGVFSSREAAGQAIVKLRALRALYEQKHDERERKRNAYLRRFEPARMGVGDKWPVYTAEQYAEADAACGPAPEHVEVGEEYKIERHGLDAVQSGTLVQEITRDQVFIGRIEIAQTTGGVRIGGE